jgi:hypothetical protein
MVSLCYPRRTPALFAVVCLTCLLLFGFLFLMLSGGWPFGPPSFPLYVNTRTFRCFCFCFCFCVRGGVRREEKRNSPMYIMDVLAKRPNSSFSFLLSCACACPISLSLFISILVLCVCVVVVWGPAHLSAPAPPPLFRLPRSPLTLLLSFFSSFSVSWFRLSRNVEEGEEVCSPSTYNIGRVPRHLLLLPLSPLLFCSGLICVSSFLIYPCKDFFVVVGHLLF